MERAEQIAQARLLADYMRRRTTALAEDVHVEAVSAYTCPQRAARERAVLFGGLPLNLGLSARLPNPGDYLTEDHAGVPILLVRDRDGTLRAFLNACRHRGARVAEGSGERAGGFTCPYHAWSYGLDGQLRSRPNEAAFAGQDRAGCGLIPLPVTERHGLIFVTPRPGAALDADAALGGLGGEIASYGFARYVHYRTRIMRPRFNWKLVIDGFLETYHLPHLHRTTVHPILHGDLATFDAFGANLRTIAVRRSFSRMLEQPPETWDLVRHSAIIYVLFPNTVLVMQGDHLETWHAYPDPADPGACVAVLSLYTPEPAITDKARGHWDRNFDLALRTVENEDFVISEGMQRGFAAGLQETIVFGRNEPALGHLHRAYDRALAG